MIKLKYKFITNVGRNCIKVSQVPEPQGSEKKQSQKPCISGGDELGRTQQTWQLVRHGA